MAAVSSNPPPNPSKKPCKKPYPPILSNLNAINIKVNPESVIQQSVLLRYPHIL